MLEEGYGPVIAQLGGMARHAYGRRRVEIRISLQRVFKRLIIVCRRGLVGRGVNLLEDIAAAFEIVQPVGQPFQVRHVRAVEVDAVGAVERRQVERLPGAGRCGTRGPEGDTGE